MSLPGSWDVGRVVGGAARRAGSRVDAAARGRAGAEAEDEAARRAARAVGGAAAGVRYRPIAEPSRAPGAGGGQARYIRSGAPVGGGARRGNPATTKAWQTQAANKALLQFVMSHYAGGLQQGVYNKLLANEFRPPPSPFDVDAGFSRPRRRPGGLGPVGPGEEIVDFY